MNARGWLIASWLALAPALGCDGFGRAVVDRTPAPVPQQMQECESMPPACDDGYSGGPEADLTPIEIEPVALGECGSVVPSRCGADALGLARPDADAGTTDVACGDTYTLNGDGAFPSDSVRDCVALNLVVDAEQPVPERVVISGPHWKHSNIAISSTLPAVVELDAANLLDLWIDLRGPVTLRIAKDSTLAHVRMHVAAGEPQVELITALASNLAIGCDDGAFSGALTLARTRLHGARLRAHEISLESVAGDDLTLDAVQLAIVDGAIEGATLAFEHGVISATQLRQANVPACGSLTIANGLVERATIERCANEPLRAYGVSMFNATIDGDVDADHAAFSRSLFGAHDDAVITGWDSTFSAVNFCRHARHANFGNRAAVTCSGCEDAMRVVDAKPCQVAGGGVSTTKNFCDALNDLTTCPEPQPERERPH